MLGRLVFQVAFLAVGGNTERVVEMSRNPTCGGMTGQAVSLEMIGRHLGFMTANA
jgi:hypothetical protein